jgi:hypothetical protein
MAPQGKQKKEKSEPGKALDSSVAFRVSRVLLFLLLGYAARQFFFDDTSDFSFAGILSALQSFAYTFFEHSYWTLRPVFLGAAVLLGLFWLLDAFGLIK